jgi:hypothetical protein
MSSLKLKVVLSYLVLIILFSLNKATIYVRSPKELVKKFQNGTIRGSISKFGKIPYGHNIIGRLIYDPKALENGENSNFCNNNQNNELADEIYNYDDVNKVPIILADRGNCSFATKVLNIEHFGAHAALIADNKQTEDPEKVVMADDGKGSEITIAAEFISYADGKILKDYLKENKDKTVTIELDFEIVS